MVVLIGRLHLGELEMVTEGEWQGFSMRAVVETDSEVYGGMVPVLLADEDALMAEAMSRLVPRPEVFMTGWLHGDGRSAIVVARSVRFLERDEVRQEAARLKACWRQTGSIPPREGVRR